MAKFTSADIVIGAKDKTKKGISSAKKGVGALTSAVKSYGAEMAAVYMLVSKAIKIVKSLTDAYKVQEVAETKLNAALKSTGQYTWEAEEALHDFASEMESTTGIADELVTEAAAIMTTFTQISQTTFPEAIEMAANMSKMFGQDLQQSVIQLGTALNDPITGVGRLKRIGISFSEEQKKSIELFVEQNDIMSAQRVILDELQLEIGGVAKAYGETAAGGADILKASLGSLKEAMGANIADGLDPINRKLAVFIQNCADSIKKTKRLKDVLEGFEEAGPAEGLEAMKEQLGGMNENLALNIFQQEQAIKVRETQMMGLKMTTEQTEKLNKKLIEKEEIIKEAISTLESQIYWSNKAQMAAETGDAAAAIVAQNEADRAALALSNIEELESAWSGTAEAEEYALQVGLERWKAWLAELNAAEAAGKVFSEGHRSMLEDVIGGIEEKLEIIKEANEEEEEIAIARLDTYQEEVDAIAERLLAQQEYYDYLHEKRKADLEEEIAAAQEKIAAASEMFGALESTIGSFYGYQMQMLDNQLANEEITQEEYDKKRKIILTKQAKTDKAAALLQAGINVAEAITKCFAALGPFGFIMAAIVAAAGAVQLGVIAATPIPEFAAGGDFITQGPQAILVGEAGPEHVQIQPLSGPNAGGGQGNTYLEIHNYIGGDKVGKAMTKLSQNGQMLIDGRYVVHS